MATISSLGVHQPAGLRYAVDELILPEDAAPSSYTWDVISDKLDDEEVVDELLTTSNCVIWSRGSLFRKSFKFNVEKETVTQALITQFPTTGYGQDASLPEENKETGERRVLSKALVVFLKTQAHIYFLAGTSHIIHMPFEVESACAAPVGVIIQRRLRTDNVAPITLKFPRVPPNSFVSSQLSPISQRISSDFTSFSTEAMGKPKTLPLRLTSTLENMWEPPLERTDSHWPRLVCLTDPLLELGLVVTQADKPTRDRKRRTSMRSPFLDQAEEILHVESIKQPGSPANGEEEGMVIAVTVNRESSTYTVWQLSYIKNEDQFTKGRKKSNAKASRRRSSMPPVLNSGATTPVQGSMRGSFGAPLPGKKTRKPDKPDASLNVTFSLGPESPGAATRRQSRRVSSLLARADLSASHDRSAFAEQPLVAGPNDPKRSASYGSQRGRMSGGARGSLNFGNSLNQALGSVNEAPVDDLLDELRAGGDFEGFHNMGLDDHDFDGLQQEVLLTKVHSVPMGNSNVRYSMSNQPARSQSKVFVIVGPPFAVDDQNRNYLMVGIQDPLDKRLQLLTFHVSRHRKLDLAAHSRRKRPGRSSEHRHISWGQLTRAKNVVDSCQVVDGDMSVILIISENATGQRELSIHAPWSLLTTVSLPLLFSENTHSLDYRGRYANRQTQAKNRRSIGQDFSGMSVTEVCHPSLRGVIDVKDANANFHRIKIQLQPSNALVRKVLNVCRSILPAASHGEQMVASWWHIMQWLRQESFHVADPEWSSLVIQLLMLYLALGDSTPAKEPPRPTSARPWADWDTMQLHETRHSSACPTWMHNRGWQWLMDEDVVDPASSFGEPKSHEASFLSRHIRYAKKYMSSPAGVAACGPDAGYLPTAPSRTDNSRRTAATNIFLGLHLAMEEDKLNLMAPEYSLSGRAQLRVVMMQIARWLKWYDFSSMYELGLQEDPDPSNDGEVSIRPPLQQPAARHCIFTWVQSNFMVTAQASLPTLRDIFYHGSQTSEREQSTDRRWDMITPRTLMFQRLFQALKPDSSLPEVVTAMHDSGFQANVLETLPEAVVAPLQDAISICQPRPPSSWPRALLDLVGRRDVSLVLSRKKLVQPATINTLMPQHTASWDMNFLCRNVHEHNDQDNEEGDGSERQAVVRALFKEDRRLNEAQNLLSNHKPRIIRLDPQPQWSESEYLEKQKELVTQVASSSLAIPSGRGMLYYGLRFPLLTQKYPIGGFNLNCVVRPSNFTVGVDKAQYSEEKVNWAFFHQGVSAGLAISPDAKGIDTSWILFNKPGQELNNRHAGFLLALGLNGHLKSVAKWVAFKYLTPKHMMTSIGLLLGLAASYLGTMDSLITRLLSVHVTRMLPRGAAELNLSHFTQTTGIMGIGLLYCNSQHRRMSEIMMSEIEHLDDEDEENPLRNESYRLAAGFALGFINLGKGSDLRGLADMRLTEKLLTLATTTKKVEYVHVLDRSAAGAVIAVALIFLKSEDHIVARKIDVPDSILQFEYVRPDILLLRTLAKNLILWSKMEPALSWIKNSLPPEYQSRAKLTGVRVLQSKDLPFFSILAGLCFALAFRFAGSASFKVRDLLIHYLDMFMQVGRLPKTSWDAKHTGDNVAMCVDVLALSASMVMAGTGDLVVLRRLRALHGRDDEYTSYGSHLATHLAIGALFLGCGTATFGTSNLAVASLLVSFYPIFPSDVQDNRAHLQAFRHFWVLATDPRCLVTKDVATGQPVRVRVLIHLRDDGVGGGQTLVRHTPCLLPPLGEVASVATDAGPRFWNLELDFAGNGGLADKFRRHQSLYLRRRPAAEAAFPATVRALGAEALPEAVAEEAGADPLEWVFGAAAALRELTHAERALVLNRLGEGGGACGHESDSSAVDARLVLECGMDGWSRESLLGLRLLFEWADRRSVKGLGKRPGGKERRRTTTTAGGEEEDEGEVDADVKNGWWLRDSVIEMLKGRAWLAGRDGDGG